MNENNLNDMNNNNVMPNQSVPQQPISQPMNYSQAAMPNPNMNNIAPNNNMNQSPNMVPPVGNNTNKNNTLIIVIAIVVVFAIVCIALVMLNNKDENDGKASSDNTPTTNEETIKDDNTDSKDKDTNDNKGSSSLTNTKINKISQASYNGVLISFPATKEAFKGTGLTWDEDYAQRDLATGYTTSGGRLGKYPGGISISVVNLSGQTKKIEDCVIDLAIFNNPKDGSENVTFIGGINYNSTKEDVQNTMKSLGYKNVKANDYERSNYYRYFLNDDDHNYRDYIEFYFFDNVLSSVTIRAAYNN